MKQAETRQCPGCKTIFSYQEEFSHYSESGIARYGVASPECAATFFEILTIEGERYGYPPAHRLIIDAYAIQHPPHSEIQKELGITQRMVDASIQSISIHLIALYCALEKKMELNSIAAVMNQVLSHMNKQKVVFEKLKSPDHLGGIKALDVRNALSAKQLTLDEYTKLAFDWASAAWHAWSNEHEMIRKLYEKYEKTY